MMAVADCFQCFVCKQAITEEAIMTGDESYHAHCFTCRTCKRRIEELVFAKTSQGIYCMVRLTPSSVSHQQTLTVRLVTMSVLHVVDGTRKRRDKEQHERSVSEIRKTGTGMTCGMR